jgi:pimeloyl-ACP methyl ester carboxylesterase
MSTRSQVDSKRRPGPYVMVHGAWHGGWCWARLVELLQAVGHRVYTPTLTGLGDRAHLAHPGVDLALHVQDVVALLETEELNRVTLVGHSYAGMVITGVAASAAGRLSELVYLDAFVPKAGQAVLDLVPAEAAEGVRAAAREHGEGWRVPPFPPERFGVTSARDTEWLNRHLVSQPLRTFEQPLEAVGGERLKRTYIYCSRPAMGPFDQYLPLRDERGWDFHDVKSGHDAMITASAAIAKILLGSA